jgi:outer membrane protein
LYALFYRLSFLLLIFVGQNSQACTSQDNCIETNSWQVGIALGLGVKTNPLVDGDHIPLVILPDIAWYGEKAYFDNAELGYQWLNQTNVSFETFVNLDRESAFFSFLHPSNVVFPTENVGAEAPKPIIEPELDFDSPQPSLSIDDIASRKWAINAGARLRYFFNNVQIQASLQQDISSIHNGQQFELQYRYLWQWDSVRLSMRMGANWKSKALIDYYYGVSERDTDIQGLYFVGAAGWQPYLSMSMQKPINKKWSWLASLGYRALPKSLTASPIIEKNSVRSGFLGVAYRY